ncbi:MAG: hypothetical protein RLZZ188_2931 [Verrucomicrobiota bacterium]|jgi:hypothetical protein
MKKFFLPPVFFLAIASVAQAQWQNITYSLKAGWNAIYLHGDANHDTIENILVGSPAVQEIWRWNPNPNPAQFRTSSVLPSASTPEWSVWIRGNATQTTLASLTGQTAYLVKCSAPATFTGTLPAGTASGTYTLRAAFGGVILTWANVKVDANATSTTPRISAVTPNSVGGGGDLTITGVNFPTSVAPVITLLNGTTTVATLLTGLSQSATRVSATVPTGTAQGTYTLRVSFGSDPVTATVLLWNNITVGSQSIATPVITSVTPNPLPSGDTITFSGINLPAGVTPVVTLMNGSTTVATLSGVTTAEAYQLTVPQRIMLPRSVWMRGGANFLGMPALGGTDAPTLSTYFATFPAAIASNARVYKYVGGDIGAGNPLPIYSPSTEKLDRNQAYWFEAAVTGDFAGPLEVLTSDPDGLVFGRTSSFVNVRLRNRTSTAMTVTLTPEDSAPVPAAYTSPQITVPSGGGNAVPLARVPLLRRTFSQQNSPVTGQLETVSTDTFVSGAFTETIPPLSEIKITLGTDRSRMTAAEGTLYASFLRVRDAGKLVDVPLPISARSSSLQGLWVGDAQVSRVDPVLRGSSGSSTARSFPLRLIIHVDANGVVRLLSQVCIGKLSGSAQEVGLSVREAALQTDRKSSAVRMSAGHLPLDLILSSSGGSFALGNFVDFGPIGLAHNDPTNPFVHTYHPDHDNRDARFQPLPAGVESYAVSRSIRLNFSSTSGLITPDADSASWGASKMVGSYVETVTGLRKEPIVAAGSFELRRVSEIADLSL